MKTQIATTKEQSQRLLECMVNSNTADMYADNYDALWDVPFKDCCRKKEVGFSPAWSLSALLSLLPTEIKEDNGSFDEISTYGLLIYPYMQGWQIDYQYCKDDECHCLKCIHDFDLIEACVKAIEWLTKNGYTLNVK